MSGAGEMSRRVRCVVLLGVAGVALCVAFFLWPLIHSRPELSAFARQKMVTGNNLRQIALALHAYQERHGHNPDNLDALIPECISKRLPNPWGDAETTATAHDWGYAFLLGSNVQYENRHVVLVASDGQHGAWILTEPGGCVWVDEQSVVAAVLKQ